MRHTITEEKSCDKCHQVTRHHDYYETCDNCSEKINRRHEGIIEWNIVCGKYDHNTESPILCGLKCALEWLVKSYPKYAKKNEIKDTFYSFNYLKPKDMRALRKVLMK